MYRRVKYTIQTCLTTPVCVCVCVRLPSCDGVLNSIGEGVPQVEAASDVGRRKAEDKLPLWVRLSEAPALSVRMR